MKSVQTLTSILLNLSISVVHKIYQQQKIK